MLWKLFICGLIDSWIVPELRVVTEGNVFVLETLLLTVHFCALTGESRPRRNPWAGIRRTPVGPSSTSTGDRPCVVRGGARVQGKGVVT